MAATVHAHESAARGYERRRPEQTLLYQTVAQHWQAFLEQADTHGGLPKFVVREVEDYLDCGILTRGCVVLSCGACGLSRVVALSCKRRGFCPSCCGRRMNDVASHLVDAVLPKVAVRQWVCTLPWALRYRVGYDRELCAAVFDAFVQELQRSYRRRAKRALGLGSVRLARTGTVTFIQRFDSALRLTPHAHTLVLDGVYVRGPDGRLRFHALPTPTLAEVADVTRRTAERIELLLRRGGLEFEAGDSAYDELSDRQPVLAGCYRAATAGTQLLGPRPGQPVMRVLAGSPRTAASAAGKLVAEVRGVNIHAERAVDGRDRAQLERLCRYLARPPLSHDRLSLLPDGQVQLALKSAWSDGTRAVVLSALDLLSRLCALVPPPGFHLTRYAGVLSSHASWRAEVVPKAAMDPALGKPQLSLFDAAKQVPRDSQGHKPAPAAQPEPRPTAGRKPWAWLLRRVFDADLSVCPRCECGSMRITAVALTASAIERALARHGLAARPPPAGPTLEKLGQLALSFGP